MSKRKIKFRVWDGERMHPVCYLETGDNDRLYCVGPNQKELDGVPVMQYTGIKDKNGQEVYEGDIAEIDLYEYVGLKQTQTIIVGENTGNRNFYSDVAYLSNMERDYIEVIGNKFENPELLEQ